MNFQLFYFIASCSKELYLQGEAMLSAKHETFLQLLSLRVNS